MSARLAAEKRFAIAAVRRACLLTATLFDELGKADTAIKDDKTPVTGAPILAPNV